MYFWRSCLGLLSVLCGLSCAYAADVIGDARAGEVSFRAACISCHQVGPRARAGFGPQLNGIVGRRAGADAQYRYSPAMAQSGIVWSEERLAAFIRKPGDVVPGTQMRFRALGYDARKMNDLLAYLRSLPSYPAHPGSATKN